jgi:hypothetical protein
MNKLTKLVSAVILVTLSSLVLGLVVHEKDEVILIALKPIQLSPFNAFTMDRFPTF